MAHKFRTCFYTLARARDLFLQHKLQSLPSLPAEDLRSSWKDGICACLENVHFDGRQLSGLIVFYDRRNRLEKGAPAGQRDEVLTRSGEDGLITDSAFVLDASLLVIAVQAGFFRKEATRLFRGLLDTPLLEFAAIPTPDKDEIFDLLKEVRARSEIT